MSLAILEEEYMKRIFWSRMIRRELGFSVGSERLIASQADDAESKQSRTGDTIAQSCDGLERKQFSPLDLRDGAKIFHLLSSL